MTYEGLDGVRYVARLQSARWKDFQPCRVIMEREDGKPMKVGGRTYPAGYVGAIGERDCAAWFTANDRYAVESTC